VIVAGVYRQLYRHCSEPLEHMAPVDPAAWARARETVHIYQAHETDHEHEQCFRVGEAWLGRKCAIILVIFPCYLVGFYFRPFAAILHCQWLDVMYITRDLLLLFMWCNSRCNNLNVAVVYLKFFTSHLLCLHVIYFYTRSLCQKYYCPFSSIPSSVILGHVSYTLRICVKYL
jgi:hypothetical protein